MHFATRCILLCRSPRCRDLIRKASFSIRKFEQYASRTMKIAPNRWYRKLADTQIALESRLANRTRYNSFMYLSILNDSMPLYKTRVISRDICSGCSMCIEQLMGLVFICFYILELLQCSNRATKWFCIEIGASCLRNRRLGTIIPVVNVGFSWLLWHIVAIC